jgi:hypothetical protein
VLFWEGQEDTVVPQVHKLQQEMRELSRQVAADFEFNAMAMKDLSLRFQQFTQQFTQQFKQFAADCDERFTQIEGRMRLQEHRWSRFFEVVDQRLSLLEKSA